MFEGSGKQLNQTETKIPFSIFHCNRSQKVESKRSFADFICMLNQ